MTNREKWDQAWKEHRDKASAALRRFRESEPNWDWSLWEEYKAESAKGDHAFGVLRRCHKRRGW